MPVSSFLEEHISQIPAFQLLIKLGDEKWIKNNTEENYNYLSLS